MGSEACRVELGGHGPFSGDGGPFGSSSGFREKGIGEGRSLRVAGSLEGCTGTEGGSKMIIGGNHAGA